MIKYEEAIEIAKKQKPNIDTCAEWGNGWEFSYSGDVGKIGGYGCTPVVIRKSDGQLMNMPAFVYQGAGGLLRVFNINTLEEIRES